MVVRLCWCVLTAVLMMMVPALAQERSVSRTHEFLTEQLASQTTRTIIRRRSDEQLVATITWTVEAFEIKQAARRLRRNADGSYSRVGTESEACRSLGWIQAERTKFDRPGTIHNEESNSIILSQLDRIELAPPFTENETHGHLTPQMHVKMTFSRPQLRLTREKPLAEWKEERSPDLRIWVGNPELASKIADALSFLRDECRSSKDVPR
jgi:hypothetical protein